MALPNVSGAFDPSSLVQSFSVTLKIFKRSLIVYFEWIAVSIILLKVSHLYDRLPRLRP